MVKDKTPQLNQQALQQWAEKNKIRIEADNEVHSGEILLSFYVTSNSCSVQIAHFDLRVASILNNTNYCQVNCWLKISQIEKFNTLLERQ